jgi:hypothetical protein
MEGSTGRMTQTVIPLTYTENSLRLIHDRLDADGNVGVVARLEGWMEPDLLRPGLLRLQQRHPRLRARITASPDGRGGAFVVGDPVEIPVEVRDVEDSSVAPRIAAEACLAPFDCAAGPLFRLLLLRHAPERLCHLVLIIHHAVADGLAIACFCDQLFTSYAAAEAGVPEPPVVPLPWVHPFAPGERVSRWRRLRFAAGLGSLILRNLVLRPFLPERVPARSESLRPIMLSAEQTTALLARIRAEKITVNSALFAAALLAVREVSGQPRVRVACQNAVRLQKFATPGGVHEQMGCFVYPSLRTYSVAGDCPFWELARRCRDDRKRFLRSEWGRAFRDVAFHEGVASPTFLKMLGRAKKQSPRGGLGRSTLAVSDLGVLPARGRYGSLSWIGLFGYGKSIYMGAAVGVISLILQNRLSLSVVGHGVGDAVTDTFAASLVRHLLGAAGAGVHAGAGVALPG